MNYFRWISCTKFHLENMAAYLAKQDIEEQYKSMDKTRVQVIAHAYSQFRRLKLGGTQWSLECVNKWTEVKLYWT